MTTPPLHPSLAPDLYSTPIKDRPPPSLKLKLRALTFNLCFFTAALVIHLAQVALLPLALLPGDDRRTLRAGLRLTKDAVEGILRAVNQFGGSSKLVLTTDGSVKLGKVVKDRNEQGNAAGLRLANQSSESVV